MKSRLRTIGSHAAEAPASVPSPWMANDCPGPGSTTIVADGASGRASRKRSVPDAVGRSTTVVAACTLANDARHATTTRPFAIIVRQRARLAARLPAVDLALDRLGDVRPKDLADMLVD